MTDADSTMESPQEFSVRGDCPHCDRTEPFDDSATAQAWLTGHIQSQHDDVLPAYENTDTDEVD